MLKPYLICAGLLLSSGSSAAFAQETGKTNFVLNGDQQTKTTATRRSEFLSLQQARPDFIGPLPADANSPFALVDQTDILFKGNFADSLDTTGNSSLIVEPRFSKLSSGDAGYERYSAEIRIGNVSFERNDTQPTGWYIFAATDGEAVSLRTDSITRVGDSMTLTLDDQITIGDVQAGVSTYVFGGTQFTFSYIETEASYSGRGGMSNSKRESFAGFSLAREF